MIAHRLAGLFLFLQAAAAASGPASPAERELMETITANTLRGHLSFLASDLLEGRDTPSRGLDLAAEYIASQFRRFGLEPPPVIAMLSMAATSRARAALRLGTTCP